MSSSRPAAIDLLVMPVVAMLREPMGASELVAGMAGAGLDLPIEQAARLLRRSSDLGLARIAEYDGNNARYVATSLGQRSAAALLAGDPKLTVGLEELERLRTELLATVGHELRTPLTAIRTSVGLLLDPGIEPTADQRQQLLGTIGRSADRMQQLLSELLDLARLRSGAAEMDRTQFDAREATREVAASIEPMAAARDQRIHLEVPDQPLNLVGDRLRLEQALLNLAANAQKFSPSGAEVVVRLEGTDEGGARWSIVDRGPGIGEDEQARLFERFFVGGADRHAAGGGAGIGLPTALAIAQAHGGTIEVESQVGHGSTFHLIVPGGSAE